MPATITKGRERNHQRDRDHHERNLSAWQAILADPIYQAIPHRVESNRYGQAIMSPPPAPEHGEQQMEIGYLLREHALGEGRVISECPVSTTEGVRAADVAWVSFERRKRSASKPFLLEAPEICIEILSPGNRIDEMELKRELYFEARAEEVWFRELDGDMRFFLKLKENPALAAAASRMCPGFPKRIVIS